VTTEVTDDRHANWSTGLVSATAVQEHVAFDLLVLGLVRAGRETKIYQVAKSCVFICFLIQGNRESSDSLCICFF
jgi:hypothetical protein